MRLIYSVLAGPNLDKYTSDPAMAGWIRDHVALVGSYTPYFDGKLAAIPNAIAYHDAYAVYAASTGSPSLASHPELIAVDTGGNKLFIPWGPQPFQQYAGDVSNPQFREFMVQAIKSTTYAPGGNYQGVFLDDVNLSPRTCDSVGNPVMPIDRSTGVVMTADSWARYFALYVQMLRVALPVGCKMVHNSIWTTPSSTAVDRQIAACDWVNLERGFGDTGLTGRTGPFSLAAFMIFVDHVHELGSSVIIDEYFAADLNYAVAGYFLIHAGADMIGFADQPFDASWPSMLSADLGYPGGPRNCTASLWSRSFSGGVVYLNEPGAAAVTVPLTRPCVGFDGVKCAEVTLGPKQGIVLMYSA